MNESLKKYGILLLLLGMIIPANLFSIELFYGVNFIFGTLFVFLIAFMYNPLWSLLAGLISSVTMFFLWHHLFATPVFMAEAFTVSLLYHFRKKGTPVEYAALFWTVLGLPLGLLIYKTGTSMSWEAVIMSTLKQFLNSLFTSSLAGFLLILPSLPFLKKRFDKEENLTPLYEMISSIVILVLLSGILFVVVKENRVYEKRSINGVKERLIDTSDSFISYLDDWKKKNGYSLYRMSYQFDKSELADPRALQMNLEFLSETLNAFDSLTIAGKTGQVIASSPPVNTLGISNLDRDYSDTPVFHYLQNSLDTAYTDIILSDDNERYLLGVGAPIRIDGQFEGFVMGMLYLDPMFQIMNQFRQNISQDITLIDASGRVIISTGPYSERSLFVSVDEGLKVPIGDGVIHWFPSDTSSSMQSFQHSRLYYKSVIPDLNWTLYLEEGLAPRAEELIRLSLENNIFILILVLLFIVLFKMGLSRITGTLERIIRIGKTDNYLSDQEWPSTRIQEFHEIISYFQSLMKLHRLDNRQMKDQNRELTKINSALIQSEENLRITLQSIGDGVIVTDESGSVTDLNPVACRLIGWTYESALNKSLDTLLDLKEEITGAGVKLMEKILQNGESIYPGTPYKLTDPQRKTAIVTIGAEPIRTSLDSDIRGAVLILRNISETRKLEEQLRQSQKLEVVGQLSGGIAHDFNNILTGILGLNKMIQSELPPDSSGREYSENIDKQIARAADLTGKLLAFSRKGKMVTKVFDLHTVINETVMILERTIDKSVSIEKRTDAKFTHINGDPVQIQSVLMNIALNARDAMPKGGTLTIATENTKGLQNIETNTGIKMITGQHLRISITDTGDGMSDDVKVRIFEPFFTTKQKNGTSGMSLSAAFGAVSEHNGVISVRSEQGRGTVFDLYFPVVKNPEIKIEFPREKAAVQADETILVIDDEEIIRNSLKAILTELGYKVFIASGGEQGLSLYRDNSREISLVILDAVMADMTGLEVLQELKKINPFVQVIIATGFSIESKSDQFRQAGAADFIGKPFSIDDLNSRIRKVLSQ